MKKILLIILITIFLFGCAKEETIITKISEVDLQSDITTNITNTMIIENKIPLNFSNECVYNNQIKFYEVNKQDYICLEDNKLVIVLDNIGFDPIDSIKLKNGVKEVISEIDSFRPDKRKKYYFNESFILGIKKVDLIPRGLYNTRIYDCIESKLVFNVENLSSCREIMIN